MNNASFLLLETGLTSDTVLLLHNLHLFVNLCAEGEAVDVVVEVQRGHPQPTTTPWCRRPRPDQASSSTTPQVAGAPWDSKGGEVDAGGRAGGEQLGRRRWRIDAVARRGRKDSRCYGGQRGRVSAAETLGVPTWPMGALPFHLFVSVTVQLNSFQRICAIFGQLSPSGARQLSFKSSQPRTHMCWREDGRSGKDDMLGQS